VTVRVGTPIETANLKLKAKETLLTQSRDQIETMLFGAPVSTESANSLSS
jgi:hypothetical protein